MDARTYVAMMPFAEPHEILGTLHPCTYLIAIADAGVDVLKVLQVNAIHDRELDVRVVKFQATMTVVEVTECSAVGAPCSLLRATPERLKVHVVWITVARLVLRIVSDVTVSYYLVMSQGYC